MSVENNSNSIVDADDDDDWVPPSAKSNQIESETDRVLLTSTESEKNQENFADDEQLQAEIEAQYYANVYNFILI